MSTYRNYVPWSKTNLGSTSYTSPKSTDTSSSKYGTKKEEPVDKTARFPASYRPNNYTASNRSKPESSINALANKYASYNKDKKPDTETLKETTVRDKYASTLTPADEKSTTGSKYSTKQDEIPKLASKYSIKEPEKPTVRDKLSTKYSSDANKYSNKKEEPVLTSKYGLKKDDGSTLSKYGIKKDDGPPITYNTRNLGRSIRGRSRDPSPDNSKLITRTSILPRSRDPSPVQDYKLGKSLTSTSSVASVRGRSRDPSPSERTAEIRAIARARSREPSPGGEKNYNYPSYRMYSRPTYSATPSVRSSKDDLTKYSTSRYSSLPRSTERTSYPSAEPTRYRSLSRQSSNLEDTKPPPPAEVVEQKKDEEDIPPTPEKVEIVEPVKMVSVTVITRGTSPTPPSSSSYLRTRRADNAKTIEKVIQRPAERPQMLDKDMQSDRMDDPTRYSRYGSTSRVASAPWSSYLDMKYSPGGGSSYTPRYSGSSRYSGSYSSREPSVTTSKSDREVNARSDNSSSNSNTDNINDTIKKSDSDRSNNTSNSTKEEKTNESSPTPNKTPEKIKSESLSRNNSTKSSKSDSSKSEAKSDKSSSKSDSSKSETKPEKSSNKSDKSASSSSSLAEDSKRRSPAKQNNQRSADSPSRTQLPPPVPKSESNNSLKTATPSTNKWPNKDFRKSALNMSSEKVSERRSKRTNSVSVSSGNDSEPSFGSEPLLAETKTDKVKSSKSLSKSKSNSASKIPHKSSSISKSLNKLVKSPSKQRRSRTKSSSSSSQSSSSSSEEDTSEEEIDNNTNKKSHSSRTSVLVSSADELPFDKSTKVSKSESHSQPKTEEAKSFLMRALGPVTSFFKKSQQSDSEKSNTLDLNAPESEKKKKSCIKHIESGERAWWLDEPVENDASKSNSSNLNCLKSQNSSEKTAPNETETNLSRQNSTSSRGSKKQVKYRLRHIDSEDKPWWMNSTDNVPDGVKKVEEEPPKKHKITHIKSGEKAWWMTSTEKEKSKESSSSDDDSSEEENNTADKQKRFSSNLEELGDRASPEGVEDTTGRVSPYDNIPQNIPDVRKSRPQNLPLFISRHTNIDDILGGTTQLFSPLTDRFLGEDIEEIDPAMVRIHDSTAQRPVIQRASTRDFSAPDYSQSLDDAALQVYKEGDYGAYLDLESSMAEQHEEMEGIQASRKNSLIVRTQLSVRVHTIIDKLQSSEGRELRRALFSLKQTFQADKDLVHGFVQLGGLACLLRVGSGADQNYQNYILRALGQVMLYVDGMNGVMNHNPTIQWLYSLIASQYRLVVKTALKLLLVFVEYSEGNCRLLVQAIRLVDGASHSLPWSNVMNLLRDFDNADTELLIYATTLINKTLSGLSDQDSFYDETDYLERQSMEGIVQRYMSRPGTDLDLLRQLQVYEAVLRFEDGDDEALRQLDDTIRKTLRNRSSVTTPNERRKSRRHSTGTAPYSVSSPSNHLQVNPSLQAATAEDEESSSSSQGSGVYNGYTRECKGNGNAGVTPALRRRRERAERQRSFIREQELRATPPQTPLELENNGVNGNHHDSDAQSNDSGNEDMKMLLQLKRENTVKDLTQKLANQNILSPVDDQNKTILENMTGLISKAKEGLAKSKSKGELARSPSTDQPIVKTEIKKTENELHWEQLIENLDRPLNLCDLDFTDLKSDDEDDVSIIKGTLNGPPPPPPPLGAPKGGPPPPPGGPPPPSGVPNPPIFGISLSRQKNESESPPKQNGNTIKKNKKTVKLFWKEVGTYFVGAPDRTIWDEMSEVSVDTHKLEHLFESRAKDLITKKQQEMNKNKEIIVLDHKRSNAINIAMTKLPPPRAIKAAILKMDSTVVTREGIEKLMNMIPSEEERGKIQEAQMANPELPLGSAEQFLLTLASISELAARLKLWAFKLDFENSEREIAEPLMDLKQGMELLKVNKTFRSVLSTLLSIGIFLNGTPVKGFQIEYLSKVPEVKDTVHKHSLLHHLCHMVMEHFPQATDLYSEIGPITRASKVDFHELAHSITHLESECKSSWDRLRALSKHEEHTAQQRNKLQDFLQDAAQRIILLGIVNRRVMNRYRKFLQWLGVPAHRASESKPHEFCRILSEFSLEYRTTRERVLQQIEKKANHRERNKTRGKMITQVGKFRTKEDRADAELRQLLGGESDKEGSVLGGTLPFRRRRQEPLRPQGRDESLTDGDDEILESLVKTATQGPPRGHQHNINGSARERKRTRHADRKSLRRTLKNGLSEEEKKHIAAYIKGY